MSSVLSFSEIYTNFGMFFPCSINTKPVDIDVPVKPCSTVESVSVLIRKVFTVGKPDSVPLKGCIHLSRDALQKSATHRALAGATNPKSLGEPPDFLFRLAPDWVYPAANIAVRAVSSCLAVSPLPACAGGLFSVTLAVRALTPVPRLREESCSAVSGLSSPFLRSEYIDREQFH